MLTRVLDPAKFSSIIYQQLYKINDDMLKQIYIILNTYKNINKHQCINVAAVFFSSHSLVFQTHAIYRLMYQKLDIC